MKRIHFIGIGGIGMSGVARLYLSQGLSVQGSDLKKTPILSELEALGAKIFIGHDANHCEGADLVVYSSSIGAQHPERLAAGQKGIPIIHRAQALAHLCEKKFTIAVTGTHGKTTTTALIGLMLQEAHRDPSIVVGGIVRHFGGNVVSGNGREIVIEADESDSSFLKYSPSIEVITNIEAEHLDYFQTMSQAEKAYRQFIERLPADGHWFGSSEDPRVMKLAKENIRPVTLYGLDLSCELAATDILECPQGKRGVSFKAWSRGQLLGELRLKIIGRHNVSNALAALGVGLRLGISFSIIQTTFEKFEGVARRFDVRYEDEEFMIVDDYAHHPTEIQKTLLAAKALGKKRIVALFQPHRYSRTAALLDDFGKSFESADKLIVTDIYAASETPRPGITGLSVLDAVKDAGHLNAVYVERGQLTEALRAQLQIGDLVISLGAGDVGEVANEISNGLQISQAAQPHGSWPSMFKTLRGQVSINEPLSKHTSLKVGGPADFWIEPEDTEDLKQVIAICRQHHIKMLVFGSGSNVLPPDEGVRAAVIHLGALYFRQIRCEGDKFMARAGIPNTLFIQYIIEHGYGGCEFLLGIPGNIGGSIAMNAGSQQQSIHCLLESVRVLDFSGNEHSLAKEDIPFRYRSSGIQETFILEGNFILPRRDPVEVRKKLDEYREYRLRTQDLQHPSAGCMFKNPNIPGCASGRLIEEAGLKGKRVGKAQVSTKHANFIINLGGASARDVRQLIEEVKAAVKEKFEIELESEVKILHEF